MLGTKRNTVFLVIALALGGSYSFLRFQHETSKVKTTETYWAETELSPVALEELLHEQTCMSSEKYFLACTNAILSVANRFNLTLSSTGQLVEAGRFWSPEMTSEKSLLSSWKALYNDGGGVKISFLEIWKKLASTVMKPEQVPMMVGAGLNGFISVFKDPHTYFIPVELFNDVVTKSNSRSSSLGMIIGFRNGHYVIRKFSEASVAENAGLKKGDILISINGQFVSGIIQNKLFEMLRGSIGEKVSIVVKRNNMEISFEIVRKERNVPTVTYSIVEGIKSVGFISINKFAKGTCVKVKESLRQMISKNIRGILLDLRDNPGGQMEEAACVASIFVGPSEKIFEVQYFDQSKKPEIYFGEEKKMTNLPVAVLVNSSSASAAEIVAGALQDLNRAVLVGERTYGKGSFQEGEYWQRNKKVALFSTKGFYYLPSGRTPQLSGLKPDIEVKFDNIVSLRESEQFLNPLKAPTPSKLKKSRSLATVECLEIPEESNVEDAQLTKAKQVVLCNAMKARAGL